MMRARHQVTLSAWPLSPVDNLRLSLFLRPICASKVEVCTVRASVCPPTNVFFSSLWEAGQADFVLGLRALGALLCATLFA